MHILQSQRPSPSKEYRIKLYEKEIKVQLLYQSPSRLNKENKDINQSIYIESNKEKKASMLTSAKKIDRSKVKRTDKMNENRQKEFYQEKIQQSKNILDKYQQFHNHLAVGKIHARIKVYSNSKLPLPKQESSNCGFIPIRTVNIAATKRNASPKSIIKIKLYSNPKLKNQLENSIQARKNSKIDLRKPEQPKKQEQKSILTPRRGRKYKLQVTTSKSRGKNDSIMSNRQQVSKEIRRIQLKGCSQNIKTDRRSWMNSVYID